MDARIVRAVVLTAVLLSLGAGYRTPNFVVQASNEGLAQRVGIAAEKYRRELAVLWLGKEMPDWSEACPITVQVAPHLGAGGETSFVFDRGEVFGWKMRVQGTEERVLDSVLPHEVTHTVLATHFRRPLPRWADEGACTTVEHSAERSKQQNLLITFLRTNKGIAFSQMFGMKEYPADMLPLYAQGYSLARYLIEQGGRKKFLTFIGEGMKRENWSQTTMTYYGYRNLAHLQESWLEWVKQGSPALDKQPNKNEQLAADTTSSGKSKSAGDSLARARFQSDDRGRPQSDASNAVRTTPRAGELAAAGRAAEANIRLATGGASTFEKSAWNTRDGFGRSDELTGARLAQSDITRPGIVRSNKQSVYERGVEPSGNAHQYPFASSAQRPSGPRAGADDRQSATISQRDVAPASSDRKANADADRRQVVLEWSRDGSHTHADR